MSPFKTKGAMSEQSIDYGFKKTLDGNMLLPSIGTSRNNNQSNKSIVYSVDNGRS